jgi:hypothetical protein
MKTVVYPIANGNYSDSHLPLLMSLRSVEKHLKEDFRVVVVSERPPQYLSDEVGYIPCKDYLSALRIATTLDTEFLWMNDDICLLRDWSWEELSVWRRSGAQVSRAGREEMQRSDSVWTRRKAEILNKLSELGNTTYDFSTHTPYVYDSETLSKILDDFYAGHKTPVETAYGNIADVRTKPLGGLLSRHHPGFLPIDVSSYGLLNFDDKGFTDHMAGFLLGMFPQPSRFEDYGTLNTSKTTINQIK